MSGSDWVRRGRALPALASVVLLFAAAAQVDAQQPARTKATYFAGDPTAPELARDYLETRPDEAIEITTFRQAGREPVEAYYAFGPVSRSSAGVCRFTATRIFPQTDENGRITWETKPPRPNDRVEPPVTMAALVGLPCPRQSAEMYTALETGISEAEFVAVSNFWNDISGSEERFERALILLPLIISPRAAARLSAFQAALFSPESEPVRLRALFRGGADAYILAFADKPLEPPNYFFSVAKSENGFQVLNFQTRF